MLNLSGGQMYIAIRIIYQFLMAQSTFHRPLTWNRKYLGNQGAMKSPGCSTSSSTQSSCIWALEKHSKQGELKAPIILDGNFSSRFLPTPYLTHKV